MKKAPTIQLGDIYPMRTSLEHLPREKKKQVEQAKKEILENTKGEIIEKIILFGSYSTGKWVDDIYQDKRGTMHEYISDIDVLVITRTDHQANNLEENPKLEERFTHGHLGKTDVQLIAHGSKYFRKQIKERRYFFMDIMEEGILLYDNGEHPIIYPGPLTPEMRLEKAEEYYEEWWEAAERLFKTFKLQLERDWNHEAAFSLHQTVENLYACFLLVYTDYKPNLHDLKKLDVRACMVRREIASAFPRANTEEKRRFKLLKDAYIKARYKRRGFHITEEDFDYLVPRIEKLHSLVGDFCQEHIEVLRHKVEGNKKTGKK
jgi:HEPN domain-containing protein